ncbi:MAG TPA: homoserine kinase [Acidimicrobiia bacterium]
MISHSTVSAPATSANLGPGFDTLALALEMRCTVTATPADEWSIEHVGEHRPVGPDTDGVLFAARKSVGEHNTLALVVDSDIPLGKGLGSSAAAFAAGVAAASLAIDGAYSLDHVFRVASELEGHADNVAAAVYGGFILVPAEGMPIRLPLHPSLNVVVGVPDGSLSTTSARSVVSTTFPREVVTRSLSRVSALIAGMMSADPHLLAAAHGDEIHETARAGLTPEVALTIQRVRNAGAWHAARSGAGPAVIALTSAENISDVGDAFRVSDAEPRHLAVATTGLI